MKNVESKISEVISHLPEWLRRDLTASDAVARLRAEETLAAMVANAVTEMGHRPIARPAWVPIAQPADLHVS